MADESKWAGLAPLANIIGVLMALAALGIVGRFALLLMRAYEGHPRFTG